MSADAAHTVAPTAGGRSEPEPAGALPPIAERFQPGLLGVDAAVGDRRGYTHAAWTLATIMRALVRDALAEADRPISVAMIGCPEPWLGAQILDWGAERVLSLDPDPARRRRLAAWRELLALSTDAWTVGADHRDGASAHQIDGGSNFAVLDARGLEWDEEETIGLLAQADRCAIVTADPHAAYAAATRLAIEQISEAPIPADAERRFVTREVVVLGGRRSR